MKKTALFAGTFAPYTIGHHSIVMRAVTMFDKIIIAIGRNNAKDLQTTAEKRVENITRIYADEPRIEVTTYEGLTADFAKEKGACCLLRGVRNVKDFEYERDLADLNREINGIETILLPCEPQYAAISSSAIRELMSYGKDVSKFLP